MCSCVQNCVSLEMSYLDKYRQEVLILSSADVTSMVRPVFTNFNATSATGCKSYSTQANISQQLYLSWFLL